MGSKFNLGNTEVVVVDGKVSCIIRGDVKVTSDSPEFQDNLKYLFVTMAVNHKKKLTALIAFLTPLKDCNVCTALQVLKEVEGIPEYLTKTINIALGLETATINIALV